VLLLLLQLQSE
jgi:hypothetical protein